MRSLLSSIFAIVIGVATFFITLLLGTIVSQFLSPGKGDFEMTIQEVNGIVPIHSAPFYVYLYVSAFIGYLLSGWLVAKLAPKSKLLNVTISGLIISFVLLQTVFTHFDEEPIVASVSVVFISVTLSLIGALIRLWQENRKVSLPPVTSNL